MTPVALDDLLATREQLIADIQSRFDENTMRFLLSLHDGAPDFDIIGRPQGADLPAVRWKRLNLRKLMEQNATKHAAQRAELEKLFG